MDQTGGLAVVDQQGALRGRRARQHQGEASVIKLAIPVFDTSPEVLLDDGGQAFTGASLAQEFGGPQAGLASQSVVHHETDAIEGRLPPVVGRHTKGKGCARCGALCSKVVRSCRASRTSDTLPWAR